MVMVDIKIKTRREYGPAGTDSIIKAVRSNSAQASYDYARRAKKYARRNVHVISGFLRDSITTEKIGHAKHQIVVGAHYGVYEEYGTRYRPPHPYFRPAIAQAKIDFVKDIRKVFQVTHR